MENFTILNAAETAERLPFGSLIEALGSGFASGCQLPERHHHTMHRSGEADATLLLMPAWTNAEEERQFLGVKLVTVVPGNMARALPTLVSTYILYDGLTGEQLALMDGNTITGRRTAATSALAGKFLSRQNSNNLLICGAGRVGGLLADAYRAVRPIQEVGVWDKNPHASKLLADELVSQGYKARVVSNLKKAIEQADIICAATLAIEPFIQGEWLQPGTHVDLIGGFTPAMREADDRTITRSHVYIDTKEALHEAGDLVQPLKSGIFSGDAVCATLAELCRAGVLARENDHMITCFKAVGSGLADLVAAKAVFHKI